MTSEANRAPEAPEGWGWLDYDGERGGGPFPTREEAFDDALVTEWERCDGYWGNPEIEIGPIRHEVVGDYVGIDVDELMERAGEFAAGEGVGGEDDDVTVDWGIAAGGRAAAEEELEAFVKAWANRHLQFNRSWWKLTEASETITLKASDLPQEWLDEAKDDEDAGVDAAVGEEGEE